MASAGEELPGHEGVDPLVDAVQARARGAQLNRTGTQAKSCHLEKREHGVLRSRQVHNRLVEPSLAEIANYVFAFSTTLPIETALVAHADDRPAKAVTGVKRRATTRLRSSLCGVSQRQHATRSRAHPGGIANVLTVLGPETQPFRGRKPPWFKVPAPGGPRYRQLSRLIESENLHTVCQEAACPNIGECWQRGTATFMILGDTCTRRCGFCNVKTGKPTWNDPLEPARVARTVARMGLRHAVITSVDRDDLPDYGASAFVGVIRQIRRQAPLCQVEVLTPDFRGEEMPLARVISERPDVFNHNVEVVPRLYPVARRGSTFERSCRVLRNAKEMGGEAVVTKSGLMVGLGESFEEMVDTLGTLREHQVQVLTIGQYLRPTENHLPIVRYWHPDEFKALEEAAYAMGFEHVAAGPLVRSSYHADQHVPQAQAGVGPVAAAVGTVPPIAAAAGAAAPPSGLVALEART